MTDYDVLCRLYAYERQRERAVALAELLALPDEPCLHRGHYYTQPCDPHRDKEVIKRDLATAYVAWRRQDWKDDVSGVVSLATRQQFLRLVRKA